MLDVLPDRSQNTLLRNPYITWLHFLTLVEQASLIGLSLSYCVSLAGVFQYGVRLSTEVESLVSLLDAIPCHVEYPVIGCNCNK